MASTQLWLLRHGEAVPHESKPDFDRELTPRGERQSAAAGEALARLGLEFAACYTSPLVRARGTAVIACKPLNVDARGARRRSARASTRTTRASCSRSTPTARRILVVGHNPSFEQVVYDLTGARVDFKKGGVAGVRVERHAGRADRAAAAARARVDRAQRAAPALTSVV